VGGGLLLINLLLWKMPVAQRMAEIGALNR
jgi:hypothetical protein